MKPVSISILPYAWLPCLMTVALLSVAVACTPLPDPPADFKGPWTAENILRCSVEAYGGKEVVLEFEDMTYQCHITVLQGTDWTKGDTDLRIKKPDLIFSFLRLENGDEKTVFYDGRERDEWINGKTTGREVEADLERRRRLTLVHAFFMEKDQNDVVLAETTKEQGLPCAVLLKKTGFETWKLWIDLERFLIRKIRLLLPPGDPASGVTGPLSVEWHYSGFRPMAGRLVPRQFQIYLNGELFQKGEITRFSLNQGLTDKDFRPDPAPQKE
jgi:hypothetical protein